MLRNKLKFWIHKPLLNNILKAQPTVPLPTTLEPLDQSGGGGSESVHLSASASQVGERWTWRRER